MFSWSRSPMTPSAMSGLRRVQKSKMAAYKPDILTTQLVGKIETQLCVVESATRTSWLRFRFSMCQLQLVVDCNIANTSPTLCRNCALYNCSNCWLRERSFECPSVLVHSYMFYSLHNDTVWLEHNENDNLSQDTNESTVINWQFARINIAGRFDPLWHERFSKYDKSSA